VANLQIWKITYENVVDADLDDRCLYVPGSGIDTAIDNGREAIKLEENAALFEEPDNWRVRGAFRIGELEDTPEDDDE
jgi:hypothetical protein